MQACEADGQSSQSHGWQRAEKAQMGIYKRRGAAPRKYIQPSHKIAACAALFKKVESTGCKNYYRQRGKKKKDQF